MKKKLVLILGTLTMGGIQTYLIRLSDELIDKYDITFIFLTRKCNEDLLSILNKNVQILYLDDFLFSRFLKKINISAINHMLKIDFMKLKKVLKNIDILHSVDSESNIVGYELSKYYNCIFTSSAYHPKEYVWNNEFYFRKIQRNLYKELPCNNIFYFNDKIRIENEKSLGRNVNVNIIPLGLNLDRYKRQKSSYKSNKIVSIGRLTYFKSYNKNFIKSIDIINKELKTNLEYHIYGDGILKAELKKIAMKQKSKIYFHGEIDYSKFPEVLENSYAFIGEGLALIEAASAGIPAIVGYDSAENGCYGFFTQLKGYESGQKIPGQQIFDYLSIFKELSNINEHEYNELSQKMMKKAEKFNIKNTSKLMIDFFENTINNNYFIKINYNRYFYSNIFWLILNYLRIRNDRNRRYDEVK